MKKIIVHGSYFGNNFGDTLLIRLLCDKIKSLQQDAQVFLAVKGNSEEQKAIGYPIASKQDLKEAEYLVFSGGGYFGEPNKDVIKWSFRNYFRHLYWLKRVRKAKKLFYGVGFGPLTFSLFRYKVLNSFMNATKVLVRDNESLEFLKDYGYNGDNVEKCVDYALSIKSVVRVKQKRVLIHLHKLPDSVIGEVVVFMHKRLSMEYDFVIFYDTPTNHSSQTVRYQPIVDSLTGRRVEFAWFENFISTKDYIDNSELIITNKLHVGIVGIACGCKVLSIPTHSKTLRLYRQLGLSNYCLPLNEFTMPKFTNAFDSLDDFKPDWNEVNRGIGDMESQLKTFLNS